MPFALHVSHHKASGNAYWGKSVETLKLIDAARARGIDVTVDVYLYLAGSATIQSIILPTWAMEGGIGQARERLKDAATRARIKSAVTVTLARSFSSDPRNVVIVTCDWDPSLRSRERTSVR